MINFFNSLELYEKLTIFSSLTFLISLLFTAFLIPKVNDLGFKLKVIDKPNFRKQHSKILVRLGGLAIFCGFLVAVTFNVVTSNLFNQLVLDFKFIKLIIFGAFCFLLLGISDDFCQKNPYLKLGFQIAIASLMYSLNISFDAIDISFLNLEKEYLILPNVITYFITVIWIAGITNSINWLDGLDGLASGISTIISFGLIIIFLNIGKLDFAFLLIALCGAMIGFLRFNFFPAKILMGDNGSYFLGSLLSLTSFKGLSSIFQINQSNIEVVVLPIHLLILLFFLPILDVVFVTVSRIINGYSPFYPDRRHIHHKLLNTKLSHRDTVIILYGVSQFFVSIGLYINEIKGGVSILCISSVILFLCLLYCINMRRKLENLH